jgi:predicted nucleic acid-binding protein
LIVVDTNILLYHAYQSQEPGLSLQARALAKKNNHWSLPTLWRHEFFNAMTTYVRSGAMDTGQAWRCYAQALALYMDQEAPVNMQRAFELSKEFGISGYDAQFVSLAESANTVLITEDKRLLKAVGDRAMSIAQYLKR